jgi:hypothetical protein
MAISFLTTVMGFFGRIKAWMDVGAMKGLVSNYLRQ